MQKDFIEYIAKSLVDDSSAVEVTEKVSEKETVIQLKVAESDLGKIIGKQGRIAQAIRTLLNASSGKAGRRFTLEILD